MLSRTYINELMETIKEKGRYLDYCLLSNLFQCEQLILIDELNKYQNEDGGFGKGLEPDVRLPFSNVVSTNEAVLILNEIDNEIYRQKVSKEIVRFYEQNYIAKTHTWEMVPKEVDEYPRASWWNYSSVQKFGYGNPNPQIVGFLYKNRQYLKKIDIDIEVQRVVDYILKDFLKESRKHNILSCLYFYNNMPNEIKDKIFTFLSEAIDKELLNQNWQDYSLEPYEIKLIAPIFLEKHQDILNKNIAYIEAKLKKGLVMPNWNWRQFDDVFDSVKYEWAGYLTFKIIKAILT